MHVMCCRWKSRICFVLVAKCRIRMHFNMTNAGEAYFYNIFNCDQAALWMVQSVRPSVHHTFLTMFPSSYHHEIFRTYYQWQKWRPYKRSRSEVKVTEVKTQLRFFPDCNSSLNSHVVMKWCTKLERCPIVFQGHPSNFKVTRGKKIADFDPNWAFLDCNSSLNSPMALKSCTKLDVV